MRRAPGSWGLPLQDGGTALKGMASEYLSCLEQKKTCGAGFGSHIQNTSFERSPIMAVRAIDSSYAPIFRYCDPIIVACPNLPCELRLGRFKAQSTAFPGGLWSYGFLLVA